MPQEQVVQFGHMNKGDVIHREHVEAMTGVAVESAEYAMKAMQLAGEVRGDLVREGKPATVAVRQGDIRIPTDPEALDHNAREAAKGWRKIRLACDRLGEIDTARLDPTEQQRLERVRDIHSQMLAAAEGARQTARRDRLMGRGQ